VAELAGTVAIVTGAYIRDGDDENIGSATAALLASEGAAVVAADVDADGAERVAARIRADGGRAISTARPASAATRSNPASR
jgi:NAD(P)-dependent dehydrogenase (short-subunit alcohol dehydrogenase family)